MTERVSPLLHLGDFLIRPKTRADALDDYLWRQDPDTTRFDGSETTAVPFSEFLLRFERDLGPGGGGRRWFALESADGVHFGTIVLFNIDVAAGEAELGITLGRPAFRERRFGTRALVAFLRLTWASTPLRRVYLHTFEWNERAHRCFLRAGFQDVARVVRGERTLLRMEARREWWLLWDGEGRFREVGAVEGGCEESGAPVTGT